MDIQLTDLKGGACFFDHKIIAGAMPDYEKDKFAYTMIRVHGYKNMYCVRETPEQVKKLVDEAKAKTGDGVVDSKTLGALHHAHRTFQGQYGDTPDAELVKAFLDKHGKQ